MADVRVSFHAPPRFDLRTDEAAFHAFLDEHGYAVVRDVLSAEEIESSTDEFWAYVTSRAPTVRRHDVSTWEDMPYGIAKSGLLDRDISHSDFCWNIKTNPRVKRAFAALWGTDELVASYDAANAFRPWAPGVDERWKSRPGWWHVDQNCRLPNRQGRVCVQGIVALTDVTEHTGGFCCIPRTHLQHEQLCSRKRARRDFVFVPEQDPLLTSPPAPPILVGMGAGDLVLWDSRLVHCNTFATAAEPQIRQDALLRLASYVCMVPRSFVGEPRLRARMWAYEERLPTSHWPDCADMKEYDDRTELPSGPRTREASAARLELIGYTSAQIGHILGGGEPSVVVEKKKKGRWGPRKAGA